MSTRFISRYRAVTASVIGALLIALALLVVISQQGLFERTVAASLLVLSASIFNICGLLFTGRAFLKWQIEDESGYMILERGSNIASILAAALGLVLLADMLHTAGDTFMSQLGMTTYLFGAVLVLAAETAYINNREWNEPQVTAYVILAFLGQAVLGVALLQTGLVASWAGWATLIWNLGFLFIFLIFRPRDIYYPVLHVFAPLLIGIALVTRGWI